MNIVVISASMRAKSQSFKVSNYLALRLKSYGQHTSVLDLHELKLPIFDNGETRVNNKADLLKQLSHADGYVFVSPEWNGMMSHGLMNMMHYVGSEMAHKPAMLVGVSAGRGGTYPIAQMRLIGHKNNHFVISPENLIVGGVKDMLNDQDLDEDAPDYPVKSRAEYALKVLVEYASALKGIRTGDVIDDSLFPNGV